METSLDKQCTGHPHAENMKLYAENAAVMKSLGNCGNLSTTVGGVIVYITQSGIKRSNTAANPGQSTSMVFEVPKPLRDAPNDGETCYIVNLTENIAYCVIWCGTFSLCQQWLKSGIIHRTKEAAEIHLKALLSFTQQP